MGTEESHTKSNFLDLSDDEAAYEESKYVILPVGYDKTASYGKGTVHGPSTIIAASHEVELYEEELSSRPYLAGIHTLPAPQVADYDPPAMVDEVAGITGKHADNGKTVIVLGGEHTVSVGPVKALAERFDNLSVIQIDAHADLRDSYQNNRFSHACTMRRIRDITRSTVGIGIRNISLEGAELARKEDIPLFYAWNIIGNDSWHEDAISKLSENVYLTIDLDGFDPSVIPGVGTPEPGGLGWYETLRFLRKLCERKNVVGFDVMELMPIAGSLVSEFTAAKLIYKLIGYRELRV